MWIRGRQIGGKTFCWARESYRYSDYEFKAASREGYEQDWPFGYKDLEPYYDKVESFIGVSGSREGLEQMPDGRFLPPMNLSCGSLLAKQVIERKFGWRVMPDRVANLTVPHHGRPACHYCDQCQRGCYTASYFNSPAVTLPAAARTGRFTLVSDPAFTTSKAQPGTIARPAPKLSCCLPRLLSPPASCSTPLPASFPKASETPPASWGITSWTISRSRARAAFLPP
ncbi:MAG: hypothetical protein DMG26_15310 [Acidobacteria bacterium]|nr:MAG: hypothetical protein DMG26_15310 [Acidobacteriota bacterium]